MFACKLIDTKNMLDKQIKYDALIIGLGKTGMSCIRYLSGKGMSLAIADNRKTPPELKVLKDEYSDLPVYLGDFDPMLFCSAKLIILSPGVSIFDPAIQYAKENGVEVIGDIELFVRNTNVPIIAITGSNGKSTVATLITEMIRASGVKAELGGNIGTPALSLFERSQPEFYILELSSFQLETIQSLNAVVSVILNISNDHMDRYNAMDDYVSAKKKIFSGNGCVVFNKDDELNLSVINENRKKICYSFGCPNEEEFGVRIINDVEWIYYGNQKILSTADVLIKSRHNIFNILAALALGMSIGLEFKSMVSAIKLFKGLPHRCELISTINNVEWINDSKGTNPGATCAAIEGVAKGNNIVLIAGGDSKCADFSSLAKSVIGRVHTAILIGIDANKIATVLDKTINIYHATSMDSAVSLATKLAKNGDSVLLSPACASMDMFSDYQERGKVFKQAVLRIQKEWEEHA
ncbi:MAG: UDP-N-acetylmuramoylalanine--D-glutamate ligase [Gammaproteobacteria bacterium]|jgi:UDP-N-acetylmuramoylalanine--D-glutamate ligase